MATTQTKTFHPRPGRPKGWTKGAVKYSKMVRQRIGDTRALLSAIEVFGPQVAAGLGNRLTSELTDGEALPDFGLSLALVGRSVNSTLDRLRKAEWQCIESGSKSAKARRSSERLARHEVYPRAVSVRRLIDSRLGKEEGRRVHGMVGKTLRKPRRLYFQLQHLVRSLDRSEELPTPLLAGLEANGETWLREIEPGYRRLTKLLAELETCELREQGARDEKTAAMSEFDATYREALRMVQAACALSGHGDRLTNRLRSYATRRLLSRRARQQRQARAEGRVKQTLRSAAGSVIGWLGGRPPSAA